MTNNKSNTNLKPKIKSAFRQAGGYVTRKDIGKAIRLRREDRPEFDRIIAAMIARGELREKEDKLMLAEKPDTLVKAVVVKVNPTFGFAKPDEAEEDVFIAGRRMMGAMPGDTVLLRLRKDRNGRTEGEVTKIVEEAPFIFTGVVQRNGGFLDVMPDKGARFPIGVYKDDGLKPKEGHKVRCELIRGGSSHFDHKAMILEDFGDAELAKNCTAAIIAASGAPTEFSAEALAEAAAIDKAGIHEKEKAQRLDLRDRIIFTIDSADTKDIDDAISLTRTENGYELGVHIADVSYYVTDGTPIDQDAYSRGTSVYYASSVIPMLPKELSNGICSLNEGEDRLAFSAIMQLDHEGHMTSYRFEKTLIRSVVKGVYVEINSIFDGTASAEILRKYERVIPTLQDMKELFGKLIRNRDERGGLDLESTESKIILDQNGLAIDIQPRHSGLSENMIEEFMLLANQCAAHFARVKQIPFVYRVHEEPNAEKLERLHGLLQACGVNDHFAKDVPTPKELSAILEGVRGGPYEQIINTGMLRCMSKAVYEEKPKGHYGLVLKDYAHFTSPIRRYPDLAIHRIMTAQLKGMDKDTMVLRYSDFAEKASKQSSEREIIAMQIERKAEDCYKAEYARRHLGESYEGRISGVTQRGLFIELENGVEGFVPASSLTPSGTMLTEGIRLSDPVSGKNWSLGDTMMITIVRADVNLGKIDFEVAPASTK